MTEQEFLALVKSDPDKANALVATEVMGWEPGTGKRTWIVQGPFEDCDCSSHDAAGLDDDFITEITPAWQIVEKMQDDGWFWDIGNGASVDGPYWVARLDRASEDEHGEGGVFHRAAHDDVEMAINIAALKARGVIK